MYITEKQLLLAYTEDDCSQINWYGVF